MGLKLLRFFVVVFLGGWCLKKKHRLNFLMHLQSPNYEKDFPTLLLISNKTLLVKQTLAVFLSLIEVTLCFIIAA